GWWVKEFSFDANGKFSLTVTPGEYIVSPFSPSDLILPDRKSDPFTVEPNGQQRSLCTAMRGFGTGAQRRLWPSENPISKDPDAQRLLFPKWTNFQIYLAAIILEIVLPDAPYVERSDA